MTHYAADRHGLLIEEHLSSNGVHVINGGATQSSTALATLGHDGAAEYTFSITWAINGASLPALAAVAGSTHVHTGSIATVLPPGDQATLVLIQAAREHATISYDPNCRPGISPDVAAARRQAEMFVAASDIVKASDEDLVWLYPDRTPDETLAAWLELGPAIVALTRGASGPVILSGKGRVEMAAEPITVADTVGAGAQRGPFRSCCRTRTMASAMRRVRADRACAGRGPFPGGMLAPADPAPYVWGSGEGSPQPAAIDAGDKQRVWRGKQIWQLEQ